MLYSKVIFLSLKKENMKYHTSLICYSIHHNLTNQELCFNKLLRAVKKLSIVITFDQVLSNVMNKEAFFVTWRMNRSGDVGQKRYSPMALDMILDQVMASNLPSINAV